MPLYEYECTACGHRTEKIQKFSDPPLTTCPHCGGSLEKVLHAPAVAFKGGGWYADGYGSAKPAAKSDADAGKSDGAKPASDTAEKKSAASPDSAPAAPAASTPAPASSAPASTSAEKK